MSEQTRIPTKPLSELVVIHNGIDYKKNPRGEEIPIYGTGGIMGYTSIALNEGPAILSGRKGSINRPFYVEGKFWNVDTIFCLKTIGENDAKWLYYSLLNTDMTKLNEATGVPSVTSKSLYSLKINYFQPNIQRGISNILTTCDTVITQTQSAISKYKAIKQGLLHDLFTRGLDATGRLRPTYREAPELYKASELGMIPREWEVKRIGDVSLLVTNGFVGIATPYYTTYDKGVPYLYGTNVREDKIEFENLRYISREFHNNHIKSQLRSGDMLCVQSGHIGTCAIVPDNFIESNCHALIITRFNKEIIYPDFISFYLNSSTGKQQMDKIIVGSTIKHVNTSDLAKHFILQPDLEEQKSIAKRLTLIDKKIKNEATLLQKYQSIKRGLMGDLLGRGEMSIIMK